jgi:hypothetical protein
MLSLPCIPDCELAFVSCQVQVHAGLPFHDVLCLSLDVAHDILVLKVGTTGYMKEKQQQQKQQQKELCVKM